jgi:hypothetical protein
LSPLTISRITGNLQRLGVLLFSAVPESGFASLDCFTYLLKMVDASLIDTDSSLDSTAPEL